MTRLFVLAIQIQNAEGVSAPIAAYDTEAEADAAWTRKLEQPDVREALRLLRATYTVSSVEYFSREPAAVVADPIEQARAYFGGLVNALDDAGDQVDPIGGLTAGTALHVLRDEVDALSARFDAVLQDAADRAARADDPHERAAARARNNDFADTGGKDWT